jgi:hypothetical protein
MNKLPQFKNQSKSYFLKAKEIMSAATASLKKYRKDKTKKEFDPRRYIGGSFVERWQGIIGLFIEIAEESPGILTICFFLINFFRSPIGTSCSIIWNK